MTDTLTAEPTETQPYVFTAHDRCDGCSAQAYVRVTLLTGELLFCGHHAYVNREALAKVAITIEGNTDHLATNRAVGEDHA